MSCRLPQLSTVSIKLDEGRMDCDLDPVLAQLNMHATGLGSLSLQLNTSWEWKPAAWASLGKLTSLTKLQIAFDRTVRQDGLGQACSNAFAASKGADCTSADMLHHSFAWVGLLAGHHVVSRRKPQVCVQLSCLLSHVREWASMAVARYVASFWVLLKTV
jgi:hypothetical protein